MGSVYLAVNQNIDQKVAIKALNANLAGSVVIRKKFRDEAQLLCSLDHPNIVKFLNFVENDDGVFLIMELIDGITLEDFINGKNGLIVENRAYEMFDQILSAFAYAHKKNVVHRDIKPANIILTNDSDGNFVPKVLDFGIATIISESTETEKGWVVGTPAYMSPEQVLGTKTDGRSDIYSLGVLLHQMLTGRAPYDTTTLSELEINNKVVKDPLPRMKEFYPYISEKMQKMVDMATAKDASKRFQSCNDFKRVLKNTLAPDKFKRKVKIAAAAIVLLLVGGGLFLGDYYRTKTAYYKDYVEQWGVPKGIYKLSASQFHHRDASYRFQYKKGKLIALSLVNSRGNIIDRANGMTNEYFERPINAIFNYRANGNIDYVLYMDRNGKSLLKKSYDEGKNGKINQIIFRYNDEFGSEKKLPRDMTGFVKLYDEDAERGFISRFAVSFDDRGFIESLHYRNENKNVGDGEHIYGKKYERDAKGRIVKEYLLGIDDNPKATSWGLGIKEFEYDSKDNWVKAVYSSVNGDPSYDTKDGFSVLAMEYDQKYGNLILQLYQDSQGNLAYPKKDRIAGYRFEYNKMGQSTKFYFLGTDKNPAYSADLGIIGAEIEYDENGYINKFTYIDENSSAAIGPDGSTYILHKNDKKGNLLEQQFFDINNNPHEISAGYSKFIYEYDDAGNQISCFYYDTKETLCLSNEGVAGWRKEYNDQNKVTKAMSYGIDNQLCENKNGVIIGKYDYDKIGNKIKTTYYDTDEKTLRMSYEGIAGYKSEYENGNEIKREVFDTEEQLVNLQEGWAYWEAKYDDMGNQTEKIWYSKNNSFIDGNKYSYDERGNKTESIVLDKNKKPKQGYLIRGFYYDENNNCIRDNFFDSDGFLEMTKAGYAEVEYDYDEKNQVIERRYYNAARKLIVNEKEGYAIRKDEFDSKGDNTKTSYFDASESLRKDDTAVKLREFDAMGRNIRATLFNDKGQPDNDFPEFIYTYDKYGNQNSFTIADGFGNKINGAASGYSIMRNEYDIRGNVISESYYDKDDKPCLNKKSNVHKITTVYDKQNNVLEKRFYDADETLAKNGYAIEKNKYDERGRLIECSWYDYLDRPFNNKTGNHRYVRSYEESGVIYETYYAVNNTIISEWKYDPNTDKWMRSDAWRRSLENLKTKLPFKLDDHTQITTIAVSGNTCTVTLTVNSSKYDLSGKQMQTLEDEGISYAQDIRKTFDMPKNATLVILGVDNAGRDLYRITK